MFWEVRARNANGYKRVRLGERANLFKKRFHGGDETFVALIRLSKKTNFNFERLTCGGGREGQRG